MDPVTQQIAEFANGQKALQREHHGCRIEGRAVVEAHPLAQGNPHREAIGAHLGKGKSQLGLDLASGVDGIELVADGTQQLHRPEGVGARWIDGVDAVFAGYYQLVVTGAGGRLMARLALAACKSTGEGQG